MPRGSFIWARTQTIRRRQILRMLDVRPLSASLSDAQRCRRPRRCLRSLEKKVRRSRRMSRRSAILCAQRRRRGCGSEFAAHGRREVKLPKAERELLSYLELHPGTHNLASSRRSVAKASTAARALARQESGEADARSRWHRGARPHSRAARAESASAGSVRSDSRGDRRRNNFRRFCCRA